MADLHQLTKDHENEVKKTIEKGHIFENEVIDVIAKYERELDLEVYDPRKTLPFMTYSSLLHQLDGVFKHGSRYYFIECKHRKTFTADHIGYFNSKLLDYALGAHIANLEHEVKGLFLTTCTVGDNHLMYALAYGIIVIDPVTPPLSRMINTCKSADLKRALLRLYEQVEQPMYYLDPSPANPGKLVKSYRYLTMKWSHDQGG